jgi:hypothetical protein
MRLIGVVEWWSDPDSESGDFTDMKDVITQSRQGAKTQSGMAFLFSAFPISAFLFAALRLCAFALSPQIGHPQWRGNPACRPAPRRPSSAFSFGLVSCLTIVRQE